MMFWGGEMALSGGDGILGAALTGDDGILGPALTGGDGLLGAALTVGDGILGAALTAGGAPFGAALTGMLGREVLTMAGEAALLGAALVCSGHSTRACFWVPPPACPRPWVDRDMRPCHDGSATTQKSPDWPC